MAEGMDAPRPLELATRRVIHDYAQDFRPYTESRRTQSELQEGPTEGREAGKDALRRRKPRQLRGVSPEALGQGYLGPERGCGAPVPEQLARSARLGPARHRRARRGHRRPEARLRYSPPDGECRHRRRPQP